MLAEPGQAARVNRGGSWNNNDPSNVRAANRNRNDPANRNNNLGFRCARTATPACSTVTAVAPVPRRSAARGRALTTRSRLGDGR
ncbi:MAG: SUMF1/EgtB/PvdO family nonheme iron enzyme [Polyangiaceae bacterium]|nr:SUMF1/EgtB/PvdO family nonheme iron enzyme [Polyangiaceae bacterium]